MAPRKDQRHLKNNSSLNIYNSSVDNLTKDYEGSIEEGNNQNHN